MAELYGVKDPYTEFWNQHLAPWQTTPTPEAKEPEGHLKEVALAIGAAFLAYRLHMHRKLKEASNGRELTKANLQMAIAVAWKAYAPTWSGKVVPALIKGYIEGVKEAKTGVIPIEILNDVAEKYGEALGQNIHTLTAQAILDGYQGQINRKVARKKAMENVLEAYGVTPRTMNTLVNIWTSKDQVSYTSSNVKSIAAARARQIITHEIKTRADIIGSQEAWSSKEHAKQIIWLHALKQGVLPIETTKVWLTKKDERVCKVCGPLDRKEAKIDEQFPGRLWSPPAHVNCRCTAVLSLNEKQQLQVAKALGRDKYDRDRRGRFAPAEERTGFVDPTVENLLRQGPVEPEKIQRIQRIQRLAPIKRTEKIERIKPIKRAQRVEEKIGHRRISRPSIQKIRSIIGRAKLPSIQKLIEDAPQEVFVESNDWMHLPEPLFTVVANWEIDHDNNLVSVGDETPFFMHERDTDYGRYQHLATPLSEMLENHWQEAMEQLYDEYAYNHEWRTFEDSEGHIYPIDADTFDVILGDEINDIAPVHQEIIHLSWMDDGVEKTKMFRSGDIAAKIGLDEAVDWYRPTVMVTFHGRPGSTEINDTKSGYSYNPGVWKLVKKYDIADDPLTHKPYDVMVAIPEELD